MERYSADHAHCHNGEIQRGPFDQQPKMRKTLLHFLLLAILTVVAPFTFAQKATVPGPNNLWAGVISTVIENDNWSGQSFIGLFPGNARYPVSQTSMRIQLGFATTNTVDIAHIVLATTLRQSTTITAIQNVKYTTLTAPYSIPVSTLCTAISVSHPCFVTLDPITITTDNQHDYYLGVFFTHDTNNNGMRVIKSTHTNFITGNFPSFTQSNIVTWFESGDTTEWVLSGNVVAMPGEASLVSHWLVAAVTD